MAPYKQWMDKDYGTGFDGENGLRIMGKWLRGALKNGQLERILLHIILQLQR
jgi:hypothetical protein